MKNKFSKLFPEYFYHIFNRTNNKEDLFRNDKNRRFFLTKYKEYLYPYVKTYAYCLLDNHFHLLIQIRETEEILNNIRLTKNIKRSQLQQQLLEISAIQNSKTDGTIVEEELYSCFERMLSMQFQRFFNSYSKSFNKQHQREGNLFNKKFKRILVDKDSYFTKLVYYIHSNPNKHGIINDFRVFPWSSYSALISNKPTLLERDTVWEWFGSKNGFIRDHLTWFDLEEIESLTLE